MNSFMLACNACNPDMLELVTKDGKYRTEFFDPKSVRGYKLFSLPLKSFDSASAVIEITPGTPAEDGTIVLTIRGTTAACLVNADGKECVITVAVGQDTLAFSYEIMSEPATATDGSKTTEHLAMIENAESGDLGTGTSSDFDIPNKRQPGAGTPRHESSGEDLFPPIPRKGGDVGDL